MLKIRQGEADDVSACLAIYNHYVARGGSTLDLAQITEAKFSMQLFGPDRILLVAEENGILKGFGRLFPWSAKPGYCRTAETSIYVAPGGLGEGVGWSLKMAVLEEARRRRLHNVIARVIATNSASRRLNERVGYRLVGIQLEVGCIGMEFVDIAIYEMILE